MCVHSRASNNLKVFTFRSSQLDSRYSKNLNCMPQRSFQLRKKKKLLYYLRASWNNTFGSKKEPVLDKCEYGFCLMNYIMMWYIRLHELLKTIYQLGLKESETVQNRKGLWILSPQIAMSRKKKGRGNIQMWAVYILWKKKDYLKEETRNQGPKQRTMENNPQRIGNMWSVGFHNCYGPMTATCLPFFLFFKLK